jgi:hypothetical protein
MNALTSWLAKWLVRTPASVIVATLLIVGGIPGLILGIGAIRAGAPTVVGILITLAPGVLASVPVVWAKRSGRI